jgi:hypothetical protein
LDLLLHIGHGKAGSSYIQNTLRLNRPELLARGIHYPPKPGGEPTRAESLTIGNARGALASPEAFRHALSASRTEAGHHLLFSSEFLFMELAAQDDYGFLPAIAREAGFERVRVLLLIRDPLGHATSDWQQRVKNGGATEPVEDGYASFDYPEKVAHVLERLDGAPGVELVVRNYSRHRSDLLDVVTRWLGLPDATLTPLPAARVNRSLTMGEIAFKRAMNRVADRRCGFLAKALCEELPDLRADEVRPSRAVQQAAFDRLLPAIERVNARLEEAERYVPDVLPANPMPDQLTFSAAQVETIALAVGGEIERLHRELEQAHVHPERIATAGRLARGLVERVRRRVRRRVAGPAAPGTGEARPSGRQPQP